MGHYDDQYREDDEEKRRYREARKRPITEHLEGALFELKKFSSKTEEEKIALMFAETALLWWKKER